MKELSPKRENFCQEYIKCGNASEAYRLAYDCSNWTSKSVNEKASVLLKDVKVKTRIMELSNEIKNKNIADAEEIQETLTRLLRGEEQEECVVVENTGDYCSEARIVKKQVVPKDRIKAGETLAKMRGYFDLKIKIENVPIIEDNI